MMVSGFRNKIKNLRRYLILEYMLAPVLRADVV